MLGLAVSTALYPRFPDAGAGRLTKLRAQAVNRESCAAVARRLGVLERMQTTAPADPDADPIVLAESDRILASVCEAVIGAVYLEFGFERTAAAVVEAFEEEIDAAVEQPVDHKSVLQEQLARSGRTVDYRIEEEQGPPHDRSFVAVAEVDGAERGRGEGRTKKAAEQEAAWQVLEAEREAV